MITRDRIAGNFAICDPVKQMANNLHYDNSGGVFFHLIWRSPPVIGCPFKMLEKAHFHHKSIRASIMNNLRI